MAQHAVVTADTPTGTVDGFEAGTMKVHLFDTFDDAHTWAIENPHWITEIVPVEER